ncbi:MAG: AEC family transporter [Rhizobiaceae bacterium]|nr:AEC family transporter [Rhizobiaceae bacterium]
MFQVVALVFPLFSLILLGYVSGRFARLPIAGLAWLNFFVIYISLPAMFFRLLSKTPIEEFANFTFLAATTFGTLIIFCIAFFVAAFRNRRNVAESTIQGFAAAYGNIGYLGPPIAIAAFGPAAGVPAALVFCLDNAMHFTLAPLLMALHKEEDSSVWTLTGQILYKILSHPFIIATIVGIAGAVFQVEPPEPIEKLLVLLSSAAAPCALFAMGVTAALRPLKNVPKELGYILPLKLVIHPLLVWGILTLIGGFDQIWVYTAVLLAALPTATNVFVIAQQYGHWRERASSAVVLTTLVSTVTVTMVIYFLKQS